MESEHKSYKSLDISFTWEMAWGSCAEMAARCTFIQLPEAAVTTLRAGSFLSAGLWLIKSVCLLKN